MCGFAAHWRPGANNVDKVVRMAKHATAFGEGASGTTRKQPALVPETEAEMRTALRKHQFRATALLVVAALVFLGCSWWQNQPGGDTWWVGFFRAAAEAGMIGGIADWFAVTALFRHPLGLPIPHTALIRSKKDQMGQALAGFVGENFLNVELITDKVTKANIPERLGAWMESEGNAQSVSREVGKLTANATRALDPDDAETFIQTQVIDRVAEPEWGPPIGRLLEGLISDGKVAPVVDEVVDWGYRKALTMEEPVVRLVDERLPQWAPKLARSLAGEKVYRELMQWITEVKNDKNHEARLAIRRQLSTFAHDLQTDPEMIARVEALKGDVMGSSAVQGASASLWEAASRGIIEQAEDPESMLRVKVAELCQQWGRNIQEDPELRASLDRRIRGAATFLADNYASEITGIISETVERWDADEASEKIELRVGKDLQFIRINGTLVGALVGAVIYTVHWLIFG